MYNDWWVAMLRLDYIYRGFCSSPACPPKVKTCSCQQPSSHCWHWTHCCAAWWFPMHDQLSKGWIPISGQGSQGSKGSLHAGNTPCIRWIFQLSILLSVLEGLVQKLETPAQKADHPCTVHIQHSLPGWPIQSQMTQGKLCHKHNCGPLQSPSRVQT